MRTVERTIYHPSRKDSFRLWHLTDMHVGAKAFDEALFRAHVNMIAQDDNAYWIGGGDYIDGISHVGDKRYKPETLAPWALGHTDLMGIQVEYAVDLLKPIAHKCLALAAGNHEWTAMNHYGRNIYWEFVRLLAAQGNLDEKTLAIGAGGFVCITFRRGTAEMHGNSWRFTAFVHHGYGGGRMQGGHALTLGRMLSDYDADVILVGHRHVLQIVPKLRTYAGGNTARVRQSWGIFMPSYLGGFVEPLESGEPVDTYPELLSLPATPLGAFPIELHPTQRRIVLQVGSDVIGQYEEQTSAKGKAA